MIFNSVDFVIFFLVVYGLYLSLKHKGQNVLLLASSYFFYGWWDARFLSLIVISTLVDYVVGLKLTATDSPKARKGLVTISLVVNLGMLGFFKYFNFFAESLQTALLQYDIHVDPRFLDIVLPVGISFYTFQTLSYTIDIYRKKIGPCRSLLDFGVFVSFFPQLVAGPIERASHLIPQVEKERRVTYQDVREGAWLLLLGFFKKVVVADNMAMISGQVFDNPEGAHGLMVIIGIYAFAWQIYGDFSGYSDIARGLSKLMGFDLMHNFRMPYFATNPSDFWRRWHISLSTWLRDYLYIPLGGSRGSNFKTYRNLLLTMILGGLWHGAAWNFVLWGIFHGGILCLHRLFEPFFAKIASLWRRFPRFGHLFSIVLFFQVTCIGWLLFAVKDVGDIATLAGNLVQPFALNGKMAILSIVFFASPLIFLDIAQERIGSDLFVKSWPKVARLVVYMVLLSYILLCGVATGETFIYFQF